MKETDIHEAIEDMRKDTLEDMTARFIPEKAYANQWNVDALHEECLRIYGLDLPISDWAKEEGIVSEEIKQRIIKISNKLIADKEEKYGTEMMRVIEKTILLRLLDQNWKDHLRSLDQLRQGIHLRAYAQRNPLNEYKGEAFSLFEEMLDTLRISVTQMLSHLTIADGTQGKDISDVILEGNNSNHGHFLPGFLDGVTASPTPTEEQKQDIKAGIDMFKGQRVRRNDPCYCGSKKRYKHCHGR
jgi:preprotein translocase subunit SecA